MALPKIDVPTYEIELPVSKTKIKYRPFLVKEQRNLLMAMESNDSSSVHSAVRDILYNCTLSEGIDIESLPIVDVEYYFINLRAKSVGEIVDSKYRCNNIVNEKECNNLMDSEMNIMNIRVDIDETNSPEIQLTDNLSVKMRYPQFGLVKDSVNMESETDITFNMIAQSIEYIYDGDQFYYGHEAQPGEMLEFVEGMNQEQFSKVEKFFDNLPKLKETVNITCSKCGFPHTIEVEGLESFFG
jgi:hypothetical protein